MSNEWKMVRLGDCATFINGRAFKPSEWSNIGKPIIRIQNLTGSNSDINYYDGEVDKKYKVYNGDILISWSASLGVFVWNQGDAVLNQHIFKVEFNKLSIDKKYFYYLVKNSLDAMDLQTHGATMKHITKGKFDNIQVPYFSIEQQRKIGAVLDKASELVEKRKAQLAELDLLAESVFYDMFGDPVTNPKGWEKKTISEFTDVKIGPFGSLLHAHDYIENGTPVINSIHMQNGAILADCKFSVTNEKASELRSYFLTEGDIILGRRGDIGRCALVTNESNGYICGTGSLFIRQSDSTNPLYLLKVLSTNEIKDDLISKAKGATMLNINCGIVLGLNIILPPIELQNQFATIISNSAINNFLHPFSYLQTSTHKLS